MKKLLASACCFIAVQNFAQAAVTSDALDMQNGKRVLVKAIAVMVNAEASRKLPPKRQTCFGNEGPLE